jgi:hypothetical protein
METMPIDLAQVDWLYVILLTLFVFVSSLIGGLLTFHRRLNGALISALIFAAIFIAWTYYPHGLPLPTHLRMQSEEPAAEPSGMPAPAAPETPARPRNPVTDITPPKNPVTDITPPANR